VQNHVSVDSLCANPSTELAGENSTENRVQIQPIQQENGSSTTGKQDETDSASAPGSAANLPVMTMPAPAQIQGASASGPMASRPVESVDDAMSRTQSTSGPAASGPTGSGSHQSPTDTMMPCAENSTGRDPPAAPVPASSGGSPTQDNSAVRGVASPERLQVPDSSAPDSSAPDTRPVTRAQKGIHRPRIYTDGAVKYVKHGFLTSSGDESLSVGDALSHTN
jgi:hypothetical protein